MLSYQRYIQQTIGSFFLLFFFNTLLFIYNFLLILFINNNNFFLGHAAMMVNKGLPNFIVESLRHKQDISQKRIGILGMAFKADIDDIRDSLSYKLGKILRFHGANVFYSDEFAKDSTFIKKEQLVKKCDIIVIGAPHSAYKNLKFPKKTTMIDLWGITAKKQR